jgi:hypothetical protein
MPSCVVYWTDLNALSRLPVDDVVRAVLHPRVAEDPERRIERRLDVHVVEPPVLEAVLRHPEDGAYTSRVNDDGPDRTMSFLVGARVVPVGG